MFYFALEQLIDIRYRAHFIQALKIGPVIDYLPCWV